MRMNQFPVFQCCDTLRGVGSETRVNANLSYIFLCKTKLSLHWLQKFDIIWTNLIPPKYGTRLQDGTTQRTEISNSVGNSNFTFKCLKNPSQKECKILSLGFILLQVLLHQEGWNLISYYICTQKALQKPYVPRNLSFCFVFWLFYFIFCHFVLFFSFLRFCFFMKHFGFLFLSSSLTLGFIELALKKGKTYRYKYILLC